VKLVLFVDPPSAETHPGLLTERGIVDVSNVVPLGHTPQLTMQYIIDRFDDLRADLQRLVTDGQAVSIDTLRLRPPLPRPGKILACIANYWEHAQREARPLNMFMKNPDAVIGPDETIELPNFTEPSSFMHEAELALVIKGPAKSVAREHWRAAVFGYTCMIDVSARGEGRYTWPKGPPASWLGKSFDTFAPLGPCIVTADELLDPNDLHVRFWSNGQLRHNYNTDDMEHRVPELIAFATSVMTLHSGDIISCGTNHEGIGNLQHGDRVEIDIEGIGRMMQKVVDPLHRQWDRGVYMGENSTHPDAIKRHRPTTAN
jgi:2-keto-4-pentenoate hydratase/2-oxohepta-3-ene-1,7-dioic acid hydratase in catechol pathway